MFTLPEFLSDFTAGLAVTAVLAVVGLVWQLRTPEKKNDCRTWVVKRLTTLLSVVKANVALLPFAVTLGVGIALEDTRLVVASQAAIAAILLVYACVAVRLIVKRIK